MKTNLRTAVLTGPQTIKIETRTPPKPEPTQVRVRLEGCGVCGSNLPVWEGRPWFSYPFPAGAPGHEGWGRVDATGDDVPHLRPGDRVAVLSYNAFADFDVAEADRVLPLPPQLAGKPFPGEALGCAMNVFRRCDIQPGQTVAIVGIGFMGALLVSLAARAGARVIAISRRPFALEMARQMGAQEVLGMARVNPAAPSPASAVRDSQAVIDQVRELTRGEGCDRVIEATGLQAPLDLAGELTKERGRLIIAGYHQDGLRQINLQLWNWRGLDVINAHERDPRVYLDGMRAAADAVAKGQLDPSPLYTDQFRLEELPSAFARMSAREGTFLKSILVYD